VANWLFFRVARSTRRNSINKGSGAEGAKEIWSPRRTFDR
jgi:hypothetical protein